MYGNGKCWYGLKKHDYIRAIKLVEESTPLGCHNQVQHKVIFHDPDDLVEKGYEVTYVHQEEGELILTGHGAIHYKFKNNLLYILMQGKIYFN